MFWARVFVPLLLACAVAAMAKKPVTPEAAAESSTPAGMTQAIWSPDSRSIASFKEDWLYLYDVATRQHRRLLATKTLETTALEPPKPERFTWVNRRVRELRLQWFPESDRLLVKLKGDLFVVRTVDGTWDQLTQTREEEADPRLAPNGRRVSFRKGHELFVFDIGSRKTRRLTFDATDTRWNGELDWVYPEELELSTAQWWSPDARHLAYLQFDVSRQPLHPHVDLLPLRAVAEPQRFPKAGTPNATVRLGVVPAAGGRTRWLDQAGGDDELIARVRWLPDSTALAIQKLNRIQNRLELRLLPATGRPGRTLLEETDRWWINIADDLAFLEDSPRLLWSSERDGFRHLYLYTLDGAVERRLTNGDWEVTGVQCVDEDNGLIFYLSTEAGPLERHLYSVRLDGAGRTQLSREPGVHAASFSPDCRYYLDTHSRHDQPPRKTLHDARGRLLDVVQEADRKPLEEYDILPAEVLRIQAPDGALLYARLIRPAGFQTGRKYPAIAVVYGGPHSQTIQNSWTGADLRQALAHAGFVVWQLDNRGSAGRGHRWEAELYRRFGEKELADQLLGVRHLVSLGFADPKRIGIYGWSYGGFLTLYALLHAPGTFRAGVAGAPVTDWRNYDTSYTERYLGLPPENEEGYRLSSPVNFADCLEGALLLIHNLEDDNVLFQHTVQMAAALQNAGKLFEMMIYPQKSHAVTGDAKKHLNAAIVDFFRRRLAGPE